MFRVNQFYNQLAIALNEMSMANYVNHSVYKILTSCCKYTQFEYKAQFCLYVRRYVRFNSSETAKRTNIKFGTIHHQIVINVLKIFVTSL